MVVLVLPFETTKEGKTHLMIKLHGITKYYLSKETMVGCLAGFEISDRCQAPKLQGRLGFRCPFVAPETDGQKPLDERKAKGNMGGPFARPPLGDLELRLNLLWGHDQKWTPSKNQQSLRHMQDARTRQSVHGMTNPCQDVNSPESRNRGHRIPLPRRLLFILQRKGAATLTFLFYQVFSVSLPDWLSSLFAKLVSNLSGPGSQGVSSLPA